MRSVKVLHLQHLFNLKKQNTCCSRCSDKMRQIGRLSMQLIHSKDLVRLLKKWQATDGEAGWVFIRFRYSKNATKKLRITNFCSLFRMPKLYLSSINSYCQSLTKLLIGNNIPKLYAISESMKLRKLMLTQAKVVVQARVRRDQILLTIINYLNYRAEGFWDFQ